LQSAEAAFAQAVAAVRGQGDTTDAPEPGKPGVQGGLQQDVRLTEVDLASLRNELASLQVMLSGEHITYQLQPSVQSNSATESASEVAAEHGSLLAEVEVLQSMSSSDDGARADASNLQSRIMELQSRVAELRLRLGDALRSP
jgi:hypothetical protein